MQKQEDSEAKGVGRGEPTTSQLCGKSGGREHPGKETAHVDIIIPQSAPHLIFLRAQALLARTACYLIVGAHIEQDGKALLWIDSSACGVQGQLAHRDAHAVAAQVSQA